MPLTAAGGANAVNHQEESSEGKGSKDAEPAVKKPKGVEKSKAALAKKKSRPAAVVTTAPGSSTACLQGRGGASLVDT